MTAPSTTETNLLRIYDVGHKNKRAVQRIPLNPFVTGTIRGEVNCAIYSPDGVYLALARTDNRTHIYDSRMLERGIVENFVHSGPDKTFPGRESYGVVHAEWRQTRSGKLGLVTGGDDGECLDRCYSLIAQAFEVGYIRLWDPLRAGTLCDNGRPVAEVNADVGYFSIGDRSKNEYELVVYGRSRLVLEFR